MTPMMIGFADELVKMAAIEAGDFTRPPSAKSIVLAETLGPIPAIYHGYRAGAAKAREAGKSQAKQVLHGLGGAGRQAGVHIAGGGAGALTGAALAKLIQTALGGANPSIGPFSVANVLPALGAIFGSLKAEHILGAAKHI